MRKATDCLWLAASLAAVMAAGTVEHAAARNDRESESGKAAITLRVYDYTHMDRPQLLAAENVAAAVLSEAGLEARWVDCPTSRAEWGIYPDCQSAWQVNDFLLKVLPKPMADLLPKGKDALGSTPECAVDAICTTSIFYHRVSSVFETGGKASVPVLLGRAMAHELGHMLLGDDSHASKGIMRASWSDQDLKLEARPYLLFTPEQSRRMKTRLSLRTEAWQAKAAKLVR